MAEVQTRPGLLQSLSVEADAFLKTQEFTGMSRSLVKDLVEKSEVETFVGDEVILHERDEVDRFYFLKGGEAAVCVDDEPIEKIPTGSLIGLGAIFESLGLPVSIKATASCECRSISKHTFLAALQNHPEDAKLLRSVLERLGKEESVRWEKRSALMRTKRKLKAISMMRENKKASRQESETNDLKLDVSEGLGSRLAPPRDEAKRRAKVQMIRAQLQARARGVVASSPSGTGPSAVAPSPVPTRPRARLRAGTEPADLQNSPMLSQRSDEDVVPVLHLEDEEEFHSIRDTCAPEEICRAARTAQTPARASNGKA
ncbi:unnamed protein product [Effrenium voratum]|uniref:Cyclic nucleotide-binding domain-containing protein n=1 Tax=Effrenium voratum TaxID=2562239 RepID=A0AA36IAW9_9DINO|nr:unnamed protein product [Effrenium voratum]